MEVPLNVAVAEVEYADKIPEPETGLLVVIDNFAVPYGNRTRVAAVKEKRFVGIQRKPAAWIAP